MQLRSALIALLAGVVLAACGGSGSAPTFNLTFEAPGGSGLVGGQVGGLTYVPTRTQDFTLPPIAAFRFSLGSASLTMLEWRGGRAVLRLLGDTSHWNGKL